jgi:hypothetical protein
MTSELAAKADRPLGRSVNVTIRSVVGIPETVTKARRPSAERPVLVTSLEGQPDR